MSSPCLGSTGSYGRFVSEFSEPEDQFFKQKSYKIRLFIFRMAGQYPDAYSNNLTQRTISVELINCFPKLNEQGFSDLKKDILENIFGLAESKRLKALAAKANSPS